MNGRNLLFSFVLVIGALFPSTGKSQTTLSAGDILFTGYNAIPTGGVAPDTFSFVVMVPITSGTVIYFTERGYQGGTTWQASGTTEGTISWTSGAVAVGDEVQIAGFGASAATINGVANGSVAIVAGGNATTGLSLSNAGDQVIAFQGGSGNPAGVGAVMISGISWALSCGTTTIAGWNGAGCTYGAQSSAMPPGLTGGTNAFLAGTAGATPNSDHGKFNCNGTPYSSVASLKTAILTLSNWVFSTGGTTVYDLPSACGSFYASCSNPVITTAPSNSTVCNSANTTFTVAATGASGYQWQVNSGAGFSNISAGAPYSNVTTSTLTITGVTSGMNGYAYRCVAINGSCQTTSGSGTLTVSTPSVTVSSKTDVSCFGGATGSATVNNASGGIGPYTYNWTPGNPTGDGTTTITGLTAGSWTCTVTDNIGCIGTQVFTITQPSSTPGANSYAIPTANSTVIQPVNNYNYLSNSCELVTALVASGSSPVSGSVTHKVWIESSVPSFGEPFVQRHYEIMPASNAATATGTVTLYFTQAEFDNFNAHPGSTLDLPTGPSDAAGKANLRIGKYGGTSGDGSGLPASYTGGVQVLDPDDTDIVWNATSSTWEVNFEVDGFSGFVVQTVSSPLPVTWASFSIGQVNGGVRLQWKTAMEKDNAEFFVEHSIDGIHFNSIAKIVAAGNSSALQTYSYLHEAPARGSNYYRIRQVDFDGRQTYSDVKRISLTSEVRQLKVLTNPVENGRLLIAVQKGTQSVSLYTTQGRLLLTKRLGEGTHSIDVSAYAKGIYWLKTNEQTEKVILK